MKVKNPLIYFFWFLVLLNIIDIVSAAFVRGGEANPLFLFSKSLIPVVLLKVVTLGVLGFYLYRNKYNSNFGYYLTLIILILVIGVIGIAAFGNIYALQHPEILQKATAMTNDEKLQGYTNYMLLVYLLPLLLSLLAFKIYEWTLQYANIKKK